MKFSLSNLLLLTALIAVLVGWHYDHRRLADDKARLNAEAANLFSHYTAATQGSGTVVLPGGKMPPSRVYDSSLEVDRAAFLRDYRSPPFGPAQIDFGNDRSNR